MIVKETVLREVEPLIPKRNTLDPLEDDLLPGRVSTERVSGDYQATFKTVKHRLTPRPD